MTDEEAEKTLRRIDSQRTDLLVRFFDATPVDDEPVSAEEVAAVAEVVADRARGVPTIAFDEVKAHVRQLTRGIYFARGQQHSASQHVRTFVSTSATIGGR